MQIYAEKVFIEMETNEGTKQYQYIFTSYIALSGSLVV